MNPNKKTLNPKNNTPWLLCPSKSFPGKFYYFNGSTGEAAWCLSETDKNLKKATIHKVTDTTHTYPEPFDPPIDDSTNTTNSLISLRNADNTEFTHNAKKTRPLPVFGQATFPKYVSPDDFAPDFVWALTPMYVPSQLAHEQMVDQVTQTNQPIFRPNYFQPQKTNFTPSFQFQNEPFQYKDRPMFDQTANFNCFNLPKKAQTLAKPPMKDEVCQTESYSTPKFPLKQAAASRSVENVTTLYTMDVETSTISHPSKVDNDTGKLSKLGEDDLRLKLVAKKRKLECATETEKTVKTADQLRFKPREVLTPKKRVTFDIQKSATHSLDDVQETDQSTESYRMEEISQPAPNKVWYVVTDTAALLEGWQCIEEFVKSDPRCRLLVPHAVYTELQGRSRGDTGAVSARQLLRKFAEHVSDIVVQSKPEYELSSEDCILQCCWTLLQENIHVVLISNNTHMLNKAKSIDLECYNLDGIKKNNQTTVEFQSDLKKSKIIEENDKNKSKNLFMQDLSKDDGLFLPKPNGFRVCASRKNIFDTETDPGSEFSKRDANSDKLINLTRPRSNTVFNSEITNVKDQITKLSIAGNISVNNRSKQIMENVFRTTVFNKKIDQNATTVDIQHHKSNQNPSGENNPDMNYQNVPRKLEIINKIDRNFNVTENNIEKSRGFIKVSGITKLNNPFNLDEDLERFYIKNAVVENRVKSRLDEWVCRLNQTMEGVLTEILLEKRSKMKRMMPPWNLFEAIKVTGETFKNQPFLKTIIDRFLMKFSDCSTNKEKLNKDVKPNDFIQLVGLSMILIEHLKEIVNAKELYEAEDMLVDLIKNIEDPSSDIDLSLERVETPIFCRSEISDVQAPAGFRKSRTEIVEYLKKHFAAWQTLETDNLTNAAKDKTINREANIVTTCGKDLNTLKINNTKAITVENKEADNADVANQPKVIRNVKIISAFEERLKNKAVLDVNDQVNRTIYTVSSADEKLDHQDNGTIYTVSSADEKLDCQGNGTIYTVSSTDDVKLNDVIVKTEKETYPLIKRFLVKLKSALAMIFDFINASLQECRKDMSIGKKADMLMKIQVTQQHVLKISQKLKNIIARESSGGTTVKNLLIKNGDDVEENPILTNYRETVMKFLEQTQILEDVLERMLSIINAVSATVKQEP